MVAGADAAAGSLTARAYPAISVAAVDDLFDVQNLLPELIIALGLALLIGNGLAWRKHRQGEVPKGVENAQFRPGRAVFLVVVGAILVVWASVTLFGGAGS